MSKEITKEDVLNELQKQHPHSIPTLKAMDAWAELVAEERAIGFAEWIFSYCNLVSYCSESTGDMYWSYKNKRMTEKQLYQQYLQSLTKNKQP